ncbi:hypothetical protein AMECASPLE_014973 [Ameca splendens]|uniref:KIF-binding protein n=1 Tax=Ameca splendens TaxID=208324 RepID=A0ABV0XQN0_9TELE
MYYLAQVYRNLGENDRAATYCHSTLQRQLQLNQFSPMEWALNAATLSQYYITKGQYMEGRHCLAAATVISGLAGEVPSEAAARESETESERREQLQQKRADIARCWIKYCLNLLQDAKKLLEVLHSCASTHLQKPAVDASRTCESPKTSLDCLFTSSLKVDLLCCGLCAMNMH